MHLRSKGQKANSLSQFAANYNRTIENKMETEIQRKYLFWYFLLQQKCTHRSRHSTPTSSGSTRLRKVRTHHDFAIFRPVVVVVVVFGGAKINHPPSHAPSCRSSREKISGSIVYNAPNLDFARIDFCRFATVTLKTKVTLESHRVTSVSTPEILMSSRNFCKSE
ncbi:hypothetical protein V9T40_006459 [Parthenolecanium corni]|uniref:Uncharacterized protein n=1 Tax=Parthenolecanium corni TaxID=536013 RepID=A0AAN9TZF5_9HEMI